MRHERKGATSENPGNEDDVRRRDMVKKQPRPPNHGLSRSTDCRSGERRATALRGSARTWLCLQPGLPGEPLRGTHFPSHLSTQCRPRRGIDVVGKHARMPTAAACQATSVGNGGKVTPAADRSAGLPEPQLRDYSATCPDQCLVIIMVSSELTQIAVLPQRRDRREK